MLMKLHNRKKYYCYSFHITSKRKFSTNHAALPRLTIAQASHQVRAGITEYAIIIHNIFILHSYTRKTNEIHKITHTHTHTYKSTTRLYCPHTTSLYAPTHNESIKLACYDFILQPTIRVATTKTIILTTTTSQRKQRNNGR